MALTGTVAIVGAGKMGGAMITGMLASGITSADRIVATHRREERCQKLLERHGIGASKRNVNACDADIIVHAVKPRDLPPVLKELKGLVRPGKLIISIVAGVSMRAISRGLGTKGRKIVNVVRCMPNTPGRINKGITGWTAAAGMDEEHHANARKILGAFGREKFFANEDMLDVGTALSGTGPAYFYLVMEAMIAAGVREGMSHMDARELVFVTAQGTAAFAMEFGLEHLAALRDQVTSPAGTTAAALYELERGGVRTIFADAIRAAREQSAKMGREAEEAAAAE